MPPDISSADPEPGSVASIHSEKNIGQSGSGSALENWQPLQHGLALLLYTLLTGVMTWPLSRQLTTAIPGDSFDGWQNYWNLWWVKLALVDRTQWPLTTDILYYPTGVGLYFHTLNPFNGLATLPVQLSGGLILAYNSVVFISWVLGGYGLFLLVRWWLADQGLVKGRAFGGPFVAGLIFTFAPFHMAHLLGHMQVMSLEWMPFYVLYLLRATRAAEEGRPWGRSGLMAGLFLILVGLCDWYYVLYLFLFTGVYLVWQAVRVMAGPSGDGQNRVRTLFRLPLPGILAGFSFVLILSPLLIPMVQEAIRFDFMERPLSDLYILSASLSDFLVPNRLHTLFRPESFTWIGNQIAPVSERTISIGYLPLILAGIGLWMAWRKTGFWLVVALFFVLLALGPSINLFNIDAESVAQSVARAEETGGPGFSLYGLLNETIPFMRISRSVSRYAVMVQMAVAVAAGIGLAHLLASRPGRLRTAGSILCAGIVLAEFWVAPFYMSPPDTPAFYQTLAEETGRESGDAVLNLPMNFDRPGYLLYQTVHQKPLSVAYISRDDPRTLTERAPILQHFRHLGPDILDVNPGEIGLRVLKDIRVEWVILDRYKMPGGLERSYTTDLTQTIFAEQPPIFEDDRLTVFQVPDEVEPVAYAMLGPTGWGALTTDAAMDPATGAMTGATADAIARPFRTVGPDPAGLSLHHAVPETIIELTYRSDAQSSLILGANIDINNRDTENREDMDNESIPLFELPSGPEIVTVEIRLADAIAQIENVKGRTGVTEIDQLFLRQHQNAGSVENAGPIQIISIRLFEDTASGTEFTHQILPDTHAPISRPGTAL